MSWRKLCAWRSFYATRCVQCPRGADCSGQNVVGVATTLTPLANYWAIPWNDLGSPNRHPAWAEPCLQEGACNITGGCNPPYAGPLCAACNVGATRGAGYACMPCPSPAENGAAMVGILLFAGVVLAYLVIDGVIGAGEIVKKGVLPFHTLSLRTFVSYLQVASMIVLYDMRIPDAVSALVTVETFASSAGDALVGIDCLSTMAPFELFMAKQVIIAAMPLVLSIILSLCFMNSLFSS